VNILITGAGGFIGTHLYNHMKSAHCITRIFSPSQPAGEQNSYSVDLTKNNEVETLIQELSKTKYDCVIHLASKMASKNNIEKMSIFKMNVDMIENMVFLIKRLKPEVVIHFSSMATYANVSGLFSETSLPMPQKNPDCLYGLSKFASEVILDFLLRDGDIRIVHLRVAQVYGEGMRQDRIIPVMRKELDEKNTITVYGNGERQSCFIRIDKLLESVDYFVQVKVDGVYNVGHENLSYIDLAENIVKKFGNKESTIVKKANGNEKKFNLDISKLQKMIEL